MVNTELKKEQEYLSDVYQKLQEAEKELTQLVQESGVEGRKNIAEEARDIRLNFDNISDNLDTFAMIEQKNREIDQMNLKIQSADNALKKVKRLLEAPYFGKIMVDFLDDEPEEAFYIGVNGFTDKADETLVYDWRSPIAELFYNNVIGASSYKVRQNQIDVSIANRRQFVIDKNKLLKFFDTAIAIQDDILIEALSQDSTSQMRDITATIQSEQNQIIRDMMHPILLVNGVAGSGKTSTIMQRIAYLLYSLREEITAENILILSPNDKFISYISDVLPSLGEQNPTNMTMLQFAGQYFREALEEETVYFERIGAKEVDEQTEIIRSKAFIEFIQEKGISSFDPEKTFRTIKQKGKTIISKEQIAVFYQETPENLPLVDRIQAVKARLTSFWEEKVIQMAAERETQNQILSLSEESQQAYFGQLIRDDSEESILRYGKRYLAKKYRKVTAAIRNNQWIDSNTLLDTLYFDFTNKKYQFSNQPKTLDEAVILLVIQHRFIEKLQVRSMRFVLIDEVQDYTPAQIYLLSNLFPKSSLTMVGDENQAIFNANMTFSEISSMMKERKKEVFRYDLLNSYRSSGAITKVFRKLAVTKEELEIVPIRPDGAEPEFYQTNTPKDFLNVLTSISQKLKGEKLTIITKTEAETAALEEQLAEQAEMNIEIIPSGLSKGLEFDHILVYNASPENYSDERDQKILYTVVSRGMKSLYVTYEQEKTPLFKD
ncbi:MULTISPECIES: RNA polymerase recycling motor HelD [unclassified Enterococcus]|jgi:DNA helicase-2/ATP-dependent DNA helicase PcrA|uniref:RNA polymerase recycling motor HelD n=1 Tax=unclassified Enterococcus TaxID=2608891 RepID=UPI003D2B8814